MPRIEITGDAWKGMKLRRRHLDTSGSIFGKIWRELPIAKIQTNIAWNRFNDLMDKLSARARTSGSVSISNADIENLVRLRERTDYLRTGQRWTRPELTKAGSIYKRRFQDFGKVADARLAQEAGPIVAGIGGLKRL